MTSEGGTLSLWQGVGHLVRLPRNEVIVVEFVKNAELINAAISERSTLRCSEAIYPGPKRDAWVLALEWNCEAVEPN